MMITMEDVKSLATEHHSPSVSIFLPIHLPSPAARQDRPRLRNLAREAEELLVARGYRSTLARDIVQPAHALAEDSAFWKQGCHGVALFLATAFARWYRTPVGLSEEVVIGDHFTVKQLLRVLEEDGVFFILAISTAGARIFLASRWTVREVTGLRLPNGVRSVKAETDYQNTVLGHPLTRPVARLRRGMGMVNNAGEDPEELHRIVLMEYLTRVAAVANEYFSGRNAPVVLAALPDVEGHIRPHLRFKGLMSEWIDINPDIAIAEELRERAYAMVRPVLAAARQQELDRFLTLQGNSSPKAGAEPVEIVNGARYSRVDTLFIVDGAQLWGRLKGEYEVEIHEKRTPEDDDLLERAAVDTLFHGGKAFVLPKERFPTQGAMAAIFRY